MEVITTNKQTNKQMANRTLKSQTSLDERIIGNTEFHKIQVSIPDSKSRSYEYVVKKRYQDLEYISAGAQGSVVAATDSLTGGKVAIKRIELTQSYLKFNYREIEILTRVEHDNIIKVTDIFTPVQRQSDMTYFYIVMELMEGTLNRIETELGVDHINTIIGDIIYAVHYLHENNIIHRDLKPGNIGINHDSKVKLLDFGLANLESNTKLTEKMSTRSYRAPEIWLGLHYGTKIDMWSIGCILAELCFGKNLFKVGDGKLNDDRYLNKICEVLGCPDFAAVYPELSEDSLKQLPNSPKVENAILDKMFSTSATFHEGGDDLKSLLRGLLEFNPEKRLSAEEALKHPFFDGYYNDLIDLNREIPMPKFISPTNNNFILEQKIWDKLQSFKSQD